MTKRKLAQNFWLHAKRRLFLALKIRVRNSKDVSVVHRAIKTLHDISAQMNDSRRCYRRADCCCSRNLMHANE